MLDNTQTLTNIEKPFDQLMAGLYMLITHYDLMQTDLKQSKNMIEFILHKLNQLCCHSEIEFYPQQRLALSQTRQLWKLKLLKLNNAYRYH